MIKNFGFAARPGVWWGPDEWLNSYRPEDGGVLSPDEWHAVFMRGMYTRALYAPLYRGRRGWVTRLRTSLEGIEYWAYVPNNKCDPVEWYAVHMATGYVRKAPTKQLKIGVQALFDCLPTNGSDLMLYVQMEQPLALAATTWSWWCQQNLPALAARVHLAWIAGFGIDGRIPVADIRLSVTAVAEAIWPSNYARYAYRFDKALRTLKRRHPGHFYEI